MDEISARDKRIVATLISVAQQNASNAAGAWINDGEFLNRRFKPIPFWRHAAMFVARKSTRLTYEQIGHLFGGKHNTTILHAERSINKLGGQSDVRIARYIEQVRSELK